MRKIQNIAQDLIDNLEKVIVGKRETIELVLIGLMGQGHLLIEDVPGVGKTMLARSLAKSIGCTFSRIQFTPDMLPSDITGVSVFNQNTREFEFRPGPLLSHIVLADEINRATPKTQSALLEAMEEKQLSVDGITHVLEQPFMVLATQNPIEYEGTFPLPEAQLDRFFMRVRIGYPSESDENKILELQQLRHPIESLGIVASRTDVVFLQNEIKKVFVAPAIKKYVIGIVRATREHNDIYLGASPRASLSLSRAGQAMAAMNGRDYVLPDDIKFLAEYVICHRLVIDPSARLHNITAQLLLQEILRGYPMPAGELTTEK
ncbi:MAG: MoxR family ATPase [Anaerolineae bacterium]|nr:MoxR family ATPase [Anaerolineae bacterium]